MIPVLLSIAGSDCSAGAGMQADLKTGVALGCYTLTAVTCVVSEVPGRVAGIVPMAAEFVAGQVRECLAAFPVAAIKTGMLYSADIVRAVAAELPQNCPLVVDPVMIATAGEPLMQQQALAAYRECLFPRATLLTPNADELLRLSGRAAICSAAQLRSAAQELAAQLGCAVLAKGGHLPGSTCCDILALPEGGTHAWEHERTAGISTHGTGCTLSAAVAAGLAQGLELVQAVEQGLAYTAQAIARSFSWESTYALNSNFHCVSPGGRFSLTGREECGIISVVHD